MTRTLDDWSTMFHLCLVILPPRPEASAFIPIAERIFKVFGDADCRTAFCVVGNEFIARGVLGDAEDELPLLHRPRRRVRHEPRPHPPPGLRAPAPGHHAGGRGRGLGSGRVAARWPRRSASRWRGACPPWPRPGTRHRPPAGRSESVCEPEFNAASTRAANGPNAGEGHAGSLGFPESVPGVHPCADVLLLDVCVCCSQRRVQQGPKRPGRRSPHMNRRALRLVTLALFVATARGDRSTRRRHR